MHTPASVRPSCQNHVLAALPQDDYARIQPLLRTITLQHKQSIATKGQPVEAVYFPCGAVLSLVANMEDGAMVELATVGREGMVGYLAGFGQEISSHDTMVQIPTADMRAHVMSARDFRAEVSREGAFRDAVNRYMIAAHVFVGISVACNALHEAEQRCARWLLMVHDRVGQNTFDLSHEFLAMMLGVRRPTATVIAGTLQRAGLIRYRRGHMEILDREGLEHATCECYTQLSPHFKGLQADPPPVEDLLSTERTNRINP